MVTTLFQILFLTCAIRQSAQQNLVRAKSKLSCNAINKIIDYHNEQRNLVASGKTKLPQAKNVWALKWDASLAKIAQAYANKCVFQHNPNRPKGIGENLAWQAYSFKKIGDVKEMSQQWFDEIKLYEFDAPFDLHKTGHFTQMIWADTQYVGCGLAYYVLGDITPYQTLLVCNYKPGGNVEKEKPYALFEEDKKRCERGFQYSKYPALCAQDEEQADGNYVACSGFMLQPTRMLFFFFFLYGYYRYNF